MEDIKKLIDETVKGQIQIVKKMENDIENLPFYNFLEIDKVYKITYKEFKEEKIIIARYLGAVTSGGIMKIPQIRYYQLKKDLTYYGGRRGYSKDLPIENIINIEEL